MRSFWFFGARFFFLTARRTLYFRKAEALSLSLSLFISLSLGCRYFRKPHRSNTILATTPFAVWEKKSSALKKHDRTHLCAKSKLFATALQHHAGTHQVFVNHTLSYRITSSVYKGHAGARAGRADGIRPVRRRGGSRRAGGVPAEVGVGVGLGGLAGRVSGVF